jgi:hypothetical protein
MKFKWDFYTVRRWSLYGGGFFGFIVVGTANLVYGREVNPAVYVLLAGMLGMPEVFFRQEQLRSLQDDNRREKKDIKELQEEPSDKEEP